MNLVKYVRPGESRVRSPRTGVDNSLVVDSKTLGTSINYRLTTKNVSKSGLLLSWNNDSHVPFIVNTLIEMTIDPGSRWLSRPVPCLGKVVRREEIGAAGANFGIRIVQIDNSDLEAWEACIISLEKDAEHLTSSEDFNPEPADNARERYRANQGEAPESDPLSDNISSLDLVIKGNSTF